MAYNQKKYLKVKAERQRVWIKAAVYRKLQTLARRRGGGQLQLVCEEAILAAYDIRERKR